MNEDKGTTYNTLNGTILNAADFKLNASAESLAATMSEDIQPRALVVEETTILELDEKTNFNNDDLLLVSDQEGNTNKIQLSNLIGGGVAQGNKKAVSGETVKTTLDNYPTDSQVDSKINGALADLDNIKFATVRSGTNLDIILNDYKGKVYFQLCDNNSMGTKPSGVTSGIVQTLAWDSGNYATQIYTEIDTKHRMFIRYNNNGTWTSWQKLVTESDLAIKYGSLEWLVETESIYEQWVRQSGHNVDVHFGVKLKNTLSTSPTEIARIKDVSITNPMIRSIANIGVNAWDCTENCYMAVNTSGTISVTLATTSSKRCINVNIHYIV